MCCPWKSQMKVRCGPLTYRSCFLTKASVLSSDTVNPVPPPTSCSFQHVQPSPPPRLHFPSHHHSAHLSIPKPYSSLQLELVLQISWAILLHSLVSSAAPSAPLTLFCSCFYHITSPNNYSHHDANDRIGKHVSQPSHPQKKGPQSTCKSSNSSLHGQQT